MLAMLETWVRFLGQEDPLEKEMATNSSILAWRIPWTEESGRLQSMGSQELDMTQLLNLQYQEAVNHSKLKNKIKENKQVKLHKYLIS